MDISTTTGRGLASFRRFLGKYVHGVTSASYYTPSFPMLVRILAVKRLIRRFPTKGFQWKISQEYNQE
jgi:hypothetical protein